MNYTEEDLKKISPSLLKKINTYTNKKDSLVVALQGNLGSGKTTLVQSFAKTIGLQETVQSPTFVIQKNYSLKKSPDHPFLHFVHIDAYRIEDPEEMKSLGFDKTLSLPNTLIIIEWPEQISELIPEEHLTINLEYSSQESRNISIEFSDQNITDILE